MKNTVRLAMPAEAVDIARIQRRSWQQDPTWEPMLRQISADDAAAIWHRAITRPQLAAMRVLVALGEGCVAGFAVTQPSADPDATPSTGQVAELVVSPDAGGAGHGSRLMQAAIDTLRTDGFEVATTWLPATDDARREFFVAAGWGPDGAHQELATDDERHSVKLVRLHTAIA